MDVFVKWAKKKFALEFPKVDKKEEAATETKNDEKKVEEIKDEDVEMKRETHGDTKDSRNLIQFLKNTIKYDAPDYRDVVISRLYHLEVH